MCRFIETIRVERGVVSNAAYHLRRMNATRKHFWGDARELRMEDFATAIDPRMDCAKLRFEYDGTDIYNLSCTPYSRRTVRSLRLVTDNEIDYSYKSADRSALDRLKAMRDGSDEVIIVRNGLLTDTSYTNIALFDGCEWLTPKLPLLAGTQRASLIDRQRLREADIRADDLWSFDYIALFNAMMNLGEMILPVRTSGKRK